LIYFSSCFEKNRYYFDIIREEGPNIKQVVTAVHPEEREYSEGDEEREALQSRKGSKNTDRKKSSNPTTKPSSKGTPSTTRKLLDQAAMPTEMANIVFTASCKITNKKIVLKESETKSHVKTDRVVLIGPDCT
jgi:hypothetical protein